MVAEHGQEVGNGKNHGEQAGGPKANFNLVGLAVAHQIGNPPWMALIGLTGLIRHLGLRCG